jgi:hypothetical protein
LSYHTYFSLSLSTPEGEELPAGRRAEVVRRLAELVDEEPRAWGFEEVGEHGASGYSKWRREDYEPKMVSLSREFPDVLFALHGDGEETDDLWYAYYLGGKVQEAPAEIRFPPFDPEELREPAPLHPPGVRR